MSELSMERKECDCFQQVYNEVFSSKCYSYKLLRVLGEGRFGVVAKCFNLNTLDSVAVKLLKRCNMNNFHREVQALQKIRFLDKHRNSLVRFIEHFIFQDIPCLVFEMLDKSLKDLMTERNMTPLNLHQIRPVTSQLLMAFEALQALGVTHTDLKPDNVMLTDHKNLPFRVKLIDFGLARPITSVHVGMALQAEAYRAPEVTLGLPLSEAIDMWSLGCTIAYLFFGFDIFDCTSLRGSMETICQLLGQPADHLLNEAKYSSDYFTVDEDERWIFMSASTEPAISLFNLESESSFEDMAMRFLQSTSAVEYDDWLKFVCLLKWFLSVDAASRATPRQGLNHAFVTMTHLTDNCPYKETTLACMAVVPVDDYITVRGSDEGYGDEDGVEELYDEDEPCEAMDGDEHHEWADAQNVVFLDGEKDLGGVEEQLTEVVDFDGEDEHGWLDADDLFDHEQSLRVADCGGGVVVLDFEVDICGVVKTGGEEGPVGLVGVCSMKNLNSNFDEVADIDGEEEPGGVVDFCGVDLAGGNMGLDVEEDPGGLVDLCGVDDPGGVLGLDGEEEPGGVVKSDDAEVEDNELADDDDDDDDGEVDAIITECLTEKREASLPDRQTRSDSKVKAMRSWNQENSRSIFPNCLQM